MKHSYRFIAGMAALVLVCACGCERKRNRDAARPPVAVEELEDAKPITLLTYNVLAEVADSDRRTTALMKILSESSADIIALQEVAPWFLDRLAQQPWLRKYHQIKENGRPLAPGGLHILSKFPLDSIEYRSLPGRQGRGVLVVHVRACGRRVAVATVHLDSPLREGAIRARQLDQIRPFLENADDAILIGDFNFGDGEQPETEHLDSRFVDLWTALHPQEEGLTWNMEKSGMARRNAFTGETSRRIDRILVRSNVWRATTIRIIGDAPINPGDANRFPSDHFGLFAEIVPKQ